MSSKQKPLSVGKESKAKTLSNLEAQRITALQNGDTKTAGLIARIITLLSNKKTK